MQIARAPASGDGFIQNRAALHLFYILAEIADVEALGNGDRAIVRLLFAHDHAEESGFARAVGANQAHLFAGVQLEGSVDEDQLLAVLFADVGKRDHPSAIIAASLSTVAQFLAVQVVESLESK